MEKKEFLYVGYFIDDKNRFILKIGTTKDLKQRRTQHNSYYRHKCSSTVLPRNRQFQYIWSIPLSKWNTLRFEEKNRDQWKIDLENFGTFIDNDRFILHTIPDKLRIKIKNTYEIDLTEVNLIFL